MGCSRRPGMAMRSCGTLRPANAHRSLWGHGCTVRSAVVSPDSQYVLTASWDRSAKLWNAATGECIQSFVGHSDHVRSAVFSTDGQYVLTASWDHSARTWNAAT